MELSANQKWKELCMMQFPQTHFSAAFQIFGASQSAGLKILLSTIGQNANSGTFWERLSKIQKNFRCTEPKGEKERKKMERGTLHTWETEKTRVKRSTPQAGDTFLVRALSLSEFYHHYVSQPKTLSSDTWMRDQSVATALFLGHRLADIDVLRCDEGRSPCTSGRAVLWARSHLCGREHPCGFFWSVSPGNHIEPRRNLSDSGGFKLNFRNRVRFRTSTTARAGWIARSKGYISTPGAPVGMELDWPNRTPTGQIASALAAFAAFAERRRDKA